MSGECEDVDLNGIENESSDDSDGGSEEMETNDDQNAENQEVYLPGKPLEAGEELVCDQSAYEMLHQAQTGAPCLSFDVIRDNLGENRNSYPVTTYTVAGTQSSLTHMNNIIVMKMANMHRTSKDNDGEDDESDDDDEDDAKRPQMSCAMIKHNGCVNRIRCTQFSSTVIAATWSELGKVSVWDLTPQLKAVEDAQVLARYKETQANAITPLYSFSGHQTEGFACDWCATYPGMLASGDCRRNIHIWTPTEAGSWNVDQRPLVGHTASVEDLQWSPNERHVLASCSVDKSIRIWDTRSAPNKACKLTVENAHTSDVNVIHWNANEPFIASGGDDGFLHVWDLRQFQTKTPVATFKHHTDAVTTVEWHPVESSVLASAGADNQIALWDLAAEPDEESDHQVVEGLPPQLMFIHQGQEDIKELHWHPQIPGLILSTAHTGFNIFRTISI